MRLRLGCHGIALWDLRLTLRPRRAYATLRIRRHRDLVVDHGGAEELIDRVVVVAEAWTSESHHQMSGTRVAIGGEPSGGRFKGAGMTRLGPRHDLGRHAVVGPHVGIQLLGGVQGSIRDGDREVGARRDAVRISTRRLCCFAHRAKARSIFGWSRTERQPDVESSAGQAQRPRATAAQPDGRTLRTKRPRLELEVRLFVAPEAPDAFDTAQHGADAAVTGNANRREPGMRPG